jgi:predicted ATPase/class 3 adenylate cyclase
MTELPTGTITFLFTDLEGSTRLWERHPDAMRDALASHDEILRDAVEKRSGHVVKTTGDGLHAAFATAHDATSAAVDAQRALDREPWPLPDPLQVRMGLHTAEADVRDGDYYGTAVNRAARIAAVAHGGQIVCSRATEELVRDALAPDVQLVDLGDHQLRDLARPEHIFQIRGDGLRDDFPPLRSLDTFPGNLPLRPTSFVGRDADLTKVASALERAPIVTITGVGGVGKTRLALQVAAEVIPHYPDGAWLCELAAADSPTALVQVVAVTLGVPIRSGLDPADGIVEFLKAKRLLLVLDNCEHLIDAAGALAERVIRTCSDVRIVATSREGLAVDGEQVIPLRSLGVPDDTADLDTAAASAAVSLFVERAQAAQPDFTLRAADVAAVAEICRRLDGIPLAIELAAARIVAMAPAEIAGLLDERFRLLTGGRRTAVERHQTLRATVDWSYSMLDERDRTVFDRLGVFAGSFSADAAAAVASGDGIERFDVLDALSDLVAKSLVVTEPTDDGTTRYSLLETLRQYARERLDEAGSSDDRRRRHASYYADFSEQLAPDLFTADEIAARQRIQVDLDNLRAAVSWALDRDDRDDNELGLRIPAAFFTEGAMGRSSGMSELALRALPLVDSTTPERRYRILAAAAWDAHAQAQIDRCMELSLAILAEPIPEIDYCISGHISLSGAYAFQRDLAEAARFIDEGLAVAEARGAPDWVFANALAVGAMHRLGNGDFAGGRRDAARAVEYAQRSRNPSALALATYALGWSLCGDDDEAAVEALTETIAFCQAGAIDAVLAPAQCQRGVLRFQYGRRADAVQDIRAAFERSVEIADALTIGAATVAAVAALVAEGLPDQAAVVVGALDAEVIFSFGGSGYGVFDPADVRADLEATLPATEFAAARARGAAMTYDEAVAFVRAALAALATATGADQS